MTNEHINRTVSDIEILHEDDDYIFINKPYDIVINSDDINNQNTVHRILEKQLSEDAVIKKPITNLKHGFHFVNRLDYSTSGVMCLSKSKEGACAAGKLFQTKKVKKIYTSLLRGHLKSPCIEIDEPVGYDIRHLSDNRMMCTNKEFITQGKESTTKIFLLETGYLDCEDVSRVALLPLTGRRHQLRVHCKYIGHPIVGDYTYSNKQDTRPYRMYLHAYRLILPLPNKTIDIIAPEDFVTCNWNSLRTYSSLDDVPV